MQAAQGPPPFDGACPGQRPEEPPLRRSLQSYHLLLSPLLVPSPHPILSKVRLGGLIDAREALLLSQLMDLKVRCVASFP